MAQDSERVHRVNLKPGYQIHIWWNPNLQTYCAYYRSRHSGGHHIGAPFRKELFGMLRSRIAEDLNPEFGVVRSRLQRSNPNEYNNMHQRLLKSKKNTPAK